MTRQCLNSFGDILRMISSKQHCPTSKAPSSVLFHQRVDPSNISHDSLCFGDKTSNSRSSPEGFTPSTSLRKPPTHQENFSVRPPWPAPSDSSSPTQQGLTSYVTNKQTKKGGSVGPLQYECRTLTQLNSKHVRTFSYVQLQLCC